MTPELYGTVVILVVLVMLSAFFSASETAFTSANRVKLKTMAQGGNKRAQIALNLAEDYDRLLSTTWSTSALRPWRRGCFLRC